MESTSSQSAREQLESLAAGRELALGRIFLPGRYVIGWAILMNACMLPLVLPIVLSDDWTLIVQSAFAAAMVALLLTQLNRQGVKRLNRQGVKRPRLRVEGAWILTLVCNVGLGSALALAIYARWKDDPWLGAAALLINFVGYLAAYGGQGFLVRRQLARLI